MKLILSLVFAFLFQSVYAQVWSEVSTSKTEYAYGEPIEITYKLSNNSETFHSYKGTSTYAVHFVSFSEIDITPTITTLDDYRDTLWPGETLEYSWILKPDAIGLPPKSGKHSVSIAMLGIIDSVSFNAPKYKGGLMGLYFNEELVDSALADSILVEYNVEIIRDDYPSFRVRINGFQIDSLGKALLEKNHIIEANYDERNNIEAINVVRTSVDSETPGCTFNLDQNYPNPFNPSTTLSFSLQQSGFATVSVYSVTGELIKVLVNGFLESGTQNVEFNAEGLASGVYFYKVVFEEQVQIKSMTLIK